MQWSRAARAYAEALRNGALVRLEGAVLAWPHVVSPLLTLRERVAASEAELALLPALVAPGDYALDVGACAGRYTARLRACGARVLSVEPNPDLAALLRARFRRDEEVEVLELAASDFRGHAWLEVPAGAAGLGALREGSSARGLWVRSERLGDLDVPAPRLLKMDVEGHELRALRGARSLLERSRAALLLEWEQRHAPEGLDALRALLEPLGYEGSFVWEGRLRPLAEFRLGAHQRREALDARGVARREGATYVNNFLFLTPFDAEKLRAWR